MKFFENLEKKIKRDNILLHLSWFFSFATLSSRIISDDTIIFADEWQEIKFNLEECPVINKKYVARALFRISDVIGRILLLCITWIGINGYVTIGLMCLDCIIVGWFVYKYHKFCEK